ncbi:hypothetical protein KPHVMX_20062 [Klebsiella pneumoniae]|nr:hypothetical protein KPHVMX_20062 [Klebsiella pneumoniae]
MEQELNPNQKNKVHLRLRVVKFIG